MSGRDRGLLHLFTLWAVGVVIRAGTGVPPIDPVEPRLFRASLDCKEPRCRTTVFGDNEDEVRDRLADHRKRCHGRETTGMRGNTGDG